MNLIFLNEPSEIRLIWGKMSTKVTILDGGMGHELKLRGISDGTFLSGVLANEKCSPAGNSQHSVVESIHTDYLTSGCDVVTTNSFVAVSSNC